MDLPDRLERLAEKQAQASALREKLTRSLAIRKAFNLPNDGLVKLGFFNDGSAKRSAISHVRIFHDGALCDTVRLIDFTARCGFVPKPVQIN